MLFNSIDRLLQTTAFILLCFSAIAYRIVPGTHYTEKATHATINTMILVSKCLRTCLTSLPVRAKVLLIAGISIAAKYHNLAKIQHFFSVHAWIAMLAVALYFVQWLGGLPSSFEVCVQVMQEVCAAGFYSFAWPRVDGTSGARFKPFHKFIGQSGWSLLSALLSLNAGVWQPL